MRTILIALLCASAWGQSLVTITGPLRLANSDGWTGDMTVSWPSMKCGTTNVVKGSKTYRVVNGVVPTVQVYPTASCGDNRYTINYTGGTVAYWTIPATPSSQSITSVETLTAPALPVIPPFAIGQVSGLQAALDSVTAGSGSFLGLTGVPSDNAALTAALNLKANLVSPAFTGTPTGITKVHVGLGNVDNTSDAAKPISDLTAAALAGKEPIDAAILRSSGSYTSPAWLPTTPGHSTGSGAPVSTPVKVGDTYTDTDPAGLAYTAFCTTTSACWRPGGSGSATTTPNYLQSFTSQTSVALTHNAGTDGIVAQCFNGSGVEIGYDTLTKTSTSTATVTFSIAQTGSCVVNSSGGGGGGGGGGDTTAVANSGAGEAILKTGTNVTAKTLVAGSNVTLTPGVDTITIASSGGGGSITAGPTLAESPTGTYNVNGAVVPSYLAASASLTFGSILNGACADLTMALSGALNGDSLAPGWPSAMPTGFDGIQFVSAANVVTIRLCNHSGGTVTPAAGLTFKPTILRGF